MNDQKEVQKEMNEEFNEAINQANEEDVDLSDELEQLEAEVTNTIPKANKEIIEDTRQPVKQSNKGTEENLVFL